MVWGIPVHASTFGISPYLQDVALLSGFFRMETFMVISGLLAALLIQRQGQARVLRRRLLTLGVPLAVGLILLNPVANYLAYVFHNGSIGFLAYLRGDVVPQPEGPMVWHLHLWFLVALLTYGLATPLLTRTVESHLNAFARLIREASPQTRFVLLATSIPMACLLWRLAFEVLLEQHLGTSFLFLVRVTLYYLPFFILGLVLFRAPLLLEAFARWRWGHLVLAASATIAARFYFHALPKPMAEAAKLLAEAYLAVVLAGGLFYLARRFLAQERAWIARVADASYSIYLLHFLVLYVVATVVRPWLGTGTSFLVVCMGVTLIATYLLHRYVIRPLPLLRLLFNGRIERRPFPPLPVVSVTSATAASTSASNS